MTTDFERAADILGVDSITPTNDYLGGTESEETGSKPVELKSDNFLEEDLAQMEREPTLVAQ